MEMIRTGEQGYEQPQPLKQLQIFCNQRLASIG